MKSREVELNHQGSHKKRVFNWGGKASAVVFYDRNDLKRKKVQQVRELALWL